jgi:phosphoadenylyl-sulfate reductase (thioredoxin)
MQLDRWEALSAEQMIAAAIREYGRRFAVVTSLQPQGMVIVDMAVRVDPGVRVMTLDTGRLPAETHEMIQTTERRYGVKLEVIPPDAAEVDAMVSRWGEDLFRGAVAKRRLCCHIRKVRPLAAALGEVDAYAVGLRRGQSESRAEAAKAAHDQGRLKLSPLLDWTAEQVDEYSRLHDVPRHPLLDQGYTSLGCAPCTRPTQPGEDERAGRWWWELDAAKECGLHQTPSGQLRREMDVLLEEVLAAAGSRR